MWATNEAKEAKAAEAGIALPIAHDELDVEQRKQRVKQKRSKNVLSQMFKFLLVFVSFTLLTKSLLQAAVNHGAVESLQEKLVRFAYPDVHHLFEPETDKGSAAVASSSSGAWGMGSSSSCPQYPAFNDSNLPNVPLPGQELLAARLSDAVQIDTSVSDDWPSPADSPDRWNEIFNPFFDWMARSFPKMHHGGLDSVGEGEPGTVELEKVNQHHLLYIWKGSDPSLKPLLLMAHQDVVPVNPEVADQWRYPPFSGHIDEHGVVWGRGTFDAKSWLVSISSTIEAFLEAGHVPTRTVVVSFGFMEEASGLWSAQPAGKWLEARFGKDAFAMIVDEGNPTLHQADTSNLLGKPVALPAVAEKGRMDVRMTVRTRGGHSSFPDSETSISMLAELIRAVQESPYFGARLTGEEDDYAYAQMKCFAPSPRFPAEVRSRMRDLEWALGHPRGRAAARTTTGICPRRHPLRHAAARLASALDSDRRHRQRVAHARARLEATVDRYPALRNPAETTRAADLFKAGVKLNALPERAEVIFDHRIATSSGVAELKRAYAQALAQHADKLKLDATVFGEKLRAGKPGKQEEKKEKEQYVGTLLVEEFGNGEGTMEPAPPTPIGEHAAAAAPWRFFNGVVHSVYDAQAREVTGGVEQAITVVPTLMQGNTDTRWMWALSRNIFRFGPGSLRKDTTGLGSATAGVHTVNEHYDADGLVMSTRFYRTLILGLEERTDL